MPRESHSSWVRASTVIRRLRQAQRGETGPDGDGHRYGRTGVRQHAPFSLVFATPGRRLRRPEPWMKRLHSLFARPIVRIVFLTTLVIIAVTLIILGNMPRWTAHSTAQPIAASE